MKRVKIGVIGCGAIAQVHHLPNLSDLQNEFEVTVVCDISASAARYAASRFHVPVAVTDYRQLLETDVDAVLLCQSDPKTEVALAALDAGKHLFIEKPVCFSLPEIDAMIAANRKAGTVGMAGYMKTYDPAYELARQEAAHMETIRFVQINHLHPDNALHLRQFHLERFDDHPEGAFEALQSARAAARHQAIGEVPSHVEHAFYLVAGSMIHDLYTLRHVMGMPTEVVSTEIWHDGRAITFTLVYPNGARCVASWVDLSTLWDFKETLEIYGDDKRILLGYPTGFARGILSTLTIQGNDASGRAYHHTPAIDWESAFMRELRHFHDCVVNGTSPRTSLEDSRHDIALIIDIIKRYSARSD